MTYYRKISLVNNILFAAAVCCIAFCGCQDNNEDIDYEYISSVEIITDTIPEENISVVTSDAYTDTAVNTVNVNDTVTVFDVEYPLDGTAGTLTVDADIYNTITPEDMSGIELLKECGLWSIEVINCKNNRPAFLSEIKEIESIDFADMNTYTDNTANDLSWLDGFTDIKYMNFIGLEKDAWYVANYIDTNESLNVENVRFYVKEFSVNDASSAVCCRNISCQCMPAEYLSGYTEPQDKPYIIASPCLPAYADSEGDFSYYTDEKHDKISPDSKTAAAYFINPTDDNVYLHDVSIYSRDSQWIPFGEEGNSYITINEMIPPEGEHCFEFSADELILRDRTNGVYKIVFYYSTAPDTDPNDYRQTESYIIINSSEFCGLEHLTGQQRAVFHKAYGYMMEHFSTNVYMTEEYASAHTADEFTMSFTDAFTPEYAAELTSQYIGDDGKLMAIDGARGSDITHAGTCFSVIQDYQCIYIICYTTHYHPDSMAETQLAVGAVRMIPSNDDWRVDKFYEWW